MDARTPLRPFVQLSSWRGLPWVAAGSALLSLVVYLLLAGRTAGLALLVSTLAAFAAFFALLLWRWPIERKITVNRQAEVVAYRIGLLLVVYFGLGLAILWGLNRISPEQTRVPIAWDAPMSRPWETSFLRRVSFWPFYALVLIGCHTPIPTPPGAC